MVEQRRFGNLVPHLVLLAGVAVVAFPVYLALIASTHEASVIANGEMPLTPGGLFLETYYRTLFIGSSRSTREPVANMLFNSAIMALIIAAGKIAISILSAYASCISASRSGWPRSGSSSSRSCCPSRSDLPDLQDRGRSRPPRLHGRAHLPLIASATATLLFRQFFMTVPDELVEASKIDGAGRSAFSSTPCCRCRARPWRRSS
jgi:sn-glycerol 3-phosphate transport system permease protein